MLSRQLRKIVPVWRSSQY